MPIDAVLRRLSSERAHNAYEGAHMRSAKSALLGVFGMDEGTWPWLADSVIGVRQLVDAFELIKTSLQLDRVLLNPFTILQDMFGHGSHGVVYATNVSGFIVADVWGLFAFQTGNRLR